MYSIGQGGLSPQSAAWSRIPVELRARPQWCLAGPDKRPLTADLRGASVNDRGTWTDFDAACRSAAARGFAIGYMQTADDPFACIDMDVKDGMAREALERYQSIIDTFDSYTEHSRSGRGFHVWVRGKVGDGRRRDGVEVYSQARFMICTGNVVRDKPIAERKALLVNLASLMRSKTPSEVSLRPDEPGDDLGCCVAAIAIDTPGELGQLMRGDWEGRHYPSHSEADFALMSMLARLTESNGACRSAFRLSALSRRDDKPNKYTDSHLNMTLRNARAHIAADAAQSEDGRRIAEALGWGLPPLPGDATACDLLDQLTVDWSNDTDVEVPDIIEGLVADEEVTLLGGHGGIGKSFLALQMACAVATGERVLGRDTRHCRVLYYSAEDGRKRLTRRLQRLIEHAGHDEDGLRQNLRVLDASEVEPLYGETVEHSAGKRPVFAKLLGARADFDNLKHMVEVFDPQLVIIDGASDTFDGNEIARREVRAFIKLLRRVHPLRPVAVLLNVHIDRSSARGNTTNDDGYAGSAQWHNSCRRRLFLQQEVRREKDELTDEWGVVLGDINLRVMKNQDGPPDPDMRLERGLHGLWQVGVEFTGALAFKDEADHGHTVLRLISEYYGRHTYMSTSLAPQAHTSVYATLRTDPAWPRGLSRKRATELVRQLQRDGLLVSERYQRGNRAWAERWAVVERPADAD